MSRRVVVPRRGLRSVVVVGSGVAGTAAAYAAAVAGAQVTMVNGRPGATSLGSGAIDGATARPFGDHRASVLSFFEALDLWEIGADLCVVATRAGLLREARGRDRAVLDLTRAAPGVVAVVDAGRAGWNATALARAWTAEPWARERRLEFRSASAQVLRFADEAALPDVDLAARHDDRERVAWLVDRCRSAPELQGVCAVVMGPWLGLRANVGRDLSLELGVPVGEPLSVPGGVAGLRFELARDALLSKSSVARVADRVRAVRAPTDGDLAKIETESAVLEADAVVLATGGLVAGGLVWTASPASPPFTLSFEAPASLALRGRPLNPSGSPGGAPFEAFAWSGGSSADFERAGVWVDPDGRVRKHEGSAFGWLYAAGDAAADAPRTVLEAIRSGIAAGALAGAEAVR